MTEFEEIKAKVEKRKQEERRKTQDEVIEIVKCIAAEKKQTREPATETVQEYKFTM